jgi:hypothetical protein
MQFSILTLQMINIVLHSSTIFKYKQYKYFHENAKDHLSTTTDSNSNE